MRMSTGMVATLAVLIGYTAPVLAQAYDPALRPPDQEFPAAAQQPAVATAGNLLLNPSFELNGGVASTSLTGWTLFNNNLYPGSFFAQSGDVSPLNGFSVPAPSDAAFAAMSDQTGEGLRVIYQDVTLPTGTAHFSCSVFIGSSADFAVPNPESLDPDSGVVGANQQARIDIMDSSAPIDDVGAGVLQNIFRTLPGDPGDPSHPATGYITVSADVAGGRAIRLRFAEVDNQLFFNMGVDRCSLVPQGAGAPALSTNALAALAFALLALGAATLSRRFRGAQLSRG